MRYNKMLSIIISWKRKTLSLVSVLLYDDLLGIFPYFHSLKTEFIIAHSTFTTSLPSDSGADRFHAE